ncbi:abortive phage infection protein [Photobacterium gaetbulicola]|uniref:Abortive phage infection protein n=1 Tax=Photobacterium gaetbulicola TaxID=1295392 RepID=A0A0B9GYV5_9GAMM|nr:AIPR family protein [Photobacterium gaetbulicola]KHT63921.1 abortive phage infection protein [Photobacterium gaetbulicola]
MELINFLHELQADIKSEISARFDNPNSELPFPKMVFTEIVTRHMADIGMTMDEPILFDYSAVIANANIALNGYALSDDNEQLDLFVSYYKDFNDVVKVPAKDIKKIASAGMRFLEQSRKGKLASRLDKSSDQYELSIMLEDKYADINQIQLFILTDGKVDNLTYQPVQNESSGKTVKVQVVDISRLYNHLQAGRPRDELVANFGDLSGQPLPCIWVPNELEDYDYALTVMPGIALRNLYDKYGSRVLEANVRSFLQQTGKVNKGIRDTLRESPERFMAYNNGIVIVVDELELGKKADGSACIESIRGLQIVNGGQTTASMFFTSKKYPETDLSKVSVPAKIIVLKNTEHSSEDNLIAAISKFANSQNAVKQSDLEANNPYHIEIEKLAMKTYCPDGTSRWFYERTAGSYKVMLDIEGKTPAGKRKLQVQIPSSRKINKTDLAKYLAAWNMEPHHVCLGAQKNFLKFMTGLSKKEDGTIPLPTVDDYKVMIAKTMIFKTAEKIIRGKFTAYRANITAYTIAMIAAKLPEKIDFHEIWQNQSVPNELVQIISSWSEIINTLLQTSANGKMVSEWGKKAECWQYIESHNADFRIEGE